MLNTGVENEKFVKVKWKNCKVLYFTIVQCTGLLLSLCYHMPIKVNLFVVCNVCTWLISIDMLVSYWNKVEAVKLHYFIIVIIL